MKLKKTAVCLLTCLMLTGCGWTGNRYVSITPRNERTEGNTTGAAPAATYAQLRNALQAMVSDGVESGIIYTVKMDEEALEQNMAIARRFVLEEDAIGDYAVDSITYEIGTTGGKQAVACSIAYRHGATEIRRILHLQDVSQMEKAIREAMEDFRSSVAMYVEDYQEVDALQIVQDIARKNPHMIMETPETVEAVYGSGAARVVELVFSYENSRDALRNMQGEVRPFFDSAALYVSGEGSDYQKFTQLYAFLMERFDYTIETSITPAYSLLRHGVGDSRAFAAIYAEICKRAGLECLVVAGTRMGEPWTWNIICTDGRYCHVDLLKCSSERGFATATDEEMSGYVWDYSAYPACTRLILPQETAETQPAEEEERLPEETIPEETDAAEILEEIF